jgi:hypothetical protein
MAFFTRRGNASVPEIPNVAVTGGNGGGNSRDDERDGVEV